jgi:uncharacterized membrane protein
MSNAKKISLYGMAVLYILAGVNHFISPGFYQKIMPPWLPQHDWLISISGGIEIVLGLLLLPRFTRRIAGWGIIALLIAIFPANIQMMLNYQSEHNPWLWIAVLRLPLQLVLIGWAYGFTKIKSMPPFLYGLNKVP